MWDNEDDPKKQVTLKEMDEWWIYVSQQKLKNFENILFLFAYEHLSFFLIRIFSTFRKDAFFLLRFIFTRFVYQFENNLFVT